MDSYFKAAVCDLDKLLDEFEQNTDECDFYRTPQNPYDSKQHSFSSDLDGLQHAYPTPKLHEDACMASEEISRVSHTGPNEGILNYPSQNEKSVAGPDLLSTVDSSSSKEIQASTPGRCSIPVCDLVNDTGNVIHSAGSSEDNQKLQPHDSQPSEDCLIGFGIPCIPIPVCVSSVSCSGGVSSTEQCDGDSMLQDSGHLKTEESSPLPLKSDVFAKTTISEPCGDTQRTESLKCSEMFNQPEQTACLNTACVSVTSQSSNEYSPKDETAYGKLFIYMLKHTHL